MKTVLLCHILNSDTVVFTYDVGSNFELRFFELKIYDCPFSLLGMTDKLDFLEGEKKGKDSSQAPKKAVNKKG